MIQQNMMHTCMTFPGVSAFYPNGQLLQNYVFRAPKKLNRIYEFKVSATDGYEVVKEVLNLCSR